MATIRSYSLLAAAAAVFVGQHVTAADPVLTPPVEWPMFRGNIQMTGVSASSLPDKPELLWKVETKDSIEAAAAVAEGVVYFGTLDGRFLAVSLADGSRIWQFKSEEIDGVKSSPCLAGPLVVYGDDFGNVRALDRKTGALKWKVVTQAEVISSPIFVDGKILVGSYDAMLYCIGAETGQVVWKLETEGPVHCAPSSINGQVVIAGCDGFLRLASIATGKETKALEIGGNIVSTPAVVGNDLFFGTNNNTVVAARLGDKLTSLWVYEPSRAYPFFSSPAVTDELVLIGGRDKQLHALEQKTGNKRWTFRTKGRVDSSPVVAGNRVFVGSSDGNVYGVDVDSGKKSWEYLVGAPIMAGLAAANEKLIVGDVDGNLYCFGKK